MHDPDWFEQCRQYATVEHLDPAAMRVLGGFAGPTENGEAQRVPARGLDRSQVKKLYDHLLQQAKEQIQALALEVEEVLGKDVDQDQARLFARRFRSVAVELGDLSGKSRTAGLYLIGLKNRIQEILVAPLPRALRVRAAADFYYSHAAILQHTALAPSPGRHATIGELLERSRWEKVARGIFLKTIQGTTQRGPLRATLLKVERGKANFTAMRCADPGGKPFQQFVAESGAIAGVSGGFFLYSEPDIEPPSAQFDPVGLLVHDGKMLVPPIFARGAICWDRGAHVFVSRVGLKGASIGFAAGKRLIVDAVNLPKRMRYGPVAFTRARFEATPPHSGPALIFEGRNFLGTSEEEAVPVPLNGFVLTLPGRSEYRGFVDSLEPGAVAVSLPRSPKQRSVEQAMAGGPLLVENGRVTVDLQREDFSGTAPPITFSKDETFDQNLLPRMAVGVTPEHHVLFAAIDGRDFNRSLGLTLHRTAKLMRAAGCTDALNLDGGSSKRLVVQGKTVDLSCTDIVSNAHLSDEVRPVHTAILIFPRR